MLQGGSRMERPLDVREVLESRLGERGTPHDQKFGLLAGSPRTHAVDPCSHGEVVAVRAVVQRWDTGAHLVHDVEHEDGLHGPGRSGDPLHGRTPKGLLVLIVEEYQLWQCYYIR